MENENTKKESESVPAKIYIRKYEHNNKPAIVWKNNNDSDNWNIAIYQDVAIRDDAFDNLLHSTNKLFKDFGSCSFALIKFIKSPPVYFPNERDRYIGEKEDELEEKKIYIRKYEYDWRPTIIWWDNNNWCLYARYSDTDLRDAIFERLLNSNNEDFHKTFETGCHGFIIQEPIQPPASVDSYIGKHKLVGIGKNLIPIQQENVETQAVDIEHILNKLHRGDPLSDSDLTEGISFLNNLIGMIKKMRNARFDLMEHALFVDLQSLESAKWHREFK